MLYLISKNTLGVVVVPRKIVHAFFAMSTIKGLALKQTGPGLLPLSNLDRCKYRVVVFNAGLTG